MRRILAFVLLAGFALGATEAVSIVTAGKAAADVHQDRNCWAPRHPPRPLGVRAGSRA